MNRPKVGDFVISNYNRNTDTWIWKVLEEESGQYINGYVYMGSNTWYTYKIQSYLNANGEEIANAKKRVTKRNLHYLTLVDQAWLTKQRDILDKLGNMI